MPRFRSLILSFVLLLLGLLYVYLINPDVVGFLYDDGIYLMLTQALAHGHGYRLMGMIGQPWFYKYPPLYPLGLAVLYILIFKFPFPLFSGFIHPFLILKIGNVILTLLALTFLFRYYRKIAGFPFWIALGLILQIGSHWQFIEISTELLSESLFLLITISTIYWAYKGPQNRFYIPILVLLSLAATYTRSLGLFFILATSLWLTLQPEMNVRNSSESILPSPNAHNWIVFFRKKAFLYFFPA